MERRAWGIQQVQTYLWAWPMEQQSWGRGSELQGSQGACAPHAGANQAPESKCWGKHGTCWMSFSGGEGREAEVYPQGKQNRVTIRSEGWRAGTGRGCAGRRAQQPVQLCPCLLQEQGECSEPTDSLQWANFSFISEENHSRFHVQTLLLTEPHRWAKSGLALLKLLLPSACPGSTGKVCSKPLGT